MNSFDKSLKFQIKITFVLILIFENNLILMIRNMCACWMITSSSSGFFRETHFHKIKWHFFVLFNWNEKYFSVFPEKRIPSHVHNEKISSAFKTQMQSKFVLNWNFRKCIRALDHSYYRKCMWSKCLIYLFTSTYVLKTGS